jgi:hypothetical protein
MRLRWEDNIRVYLKEIGLEDNISRVDSKEIGRIILEWILRR